MKNQVQKLIKGVIYDDPKMADDLVSNSAEVLSAITDSMDEFREVYYNSDKIDRDGNRLITPEEAIISLSVFAITCPDGPFSANRNLIIPSTMIDKKLYNQLERIDIGPKILDKYLDYRDEIAEKDEFNTKDDNVITIEAVDPKTGEIVSSYDFDNVNEASYWVINKLEDKSITQEQATYLLRTISNYNSRSEE